MSAWTQTLVRVAQHYSRVGVVLQNVEEHNRVELVFKSCKIIGTRGIEFRNVQIRLAHRVRLQIAQVIRILLAYHIQFTRDELVRDAANSRANLEHAIPYKRTNRPSLPLDETPRLLQ